VSPPKYILHKNVGNLVISSNVDQSLNVGRLVPLPSDFSRKGFGFRLCSFPSSNVWFPIDALDPMF